MSNTYLAQYYGKSSNYTDIPNRLYKEYNVKKGLRNEDGTGVRMGLTRVSDVVGYEIVDGVKENAEGDLFYRGYSVYDLIQGKPGSQGFEETCFLLLYGYLPSKADLRNFISIVRSLYALPDDFLEMNLLRLPGKNLMNKLQHATLTLYNYDEDNPDDTDPYKTMLKGVNLLAKFPSIACYAYQSKVHHFDRGSLIIHYPREDYSIAENILYMLREDKKFSPKEAELLDAILVLHADHGGGNNSTFTNVVISSTGSDLYSSISGSIGSLKGPRHGGANVKVSEMMEQVIDEIGYSTDENTIKALIRKILAGDFYDHTGLVYGFGHAVYTVSDPRAEILRRCCETVAKEQFKMEEFNFYRLFEQCTKEVILEDKNKVIPTNVDYYSGFAYEMLQIPRDMYTPLFVISRLVGWVAHNLENKLYDGKIMRPATKYVGENVDYIPMKER